MADFSASELREIKGLTNSINKEMEELAATSDKRNKKLKEEADLTKSILGTIEDSESAEKAISRLRGQAVRSSQKDLGVNTYLKHMLLLQQTIAKETLDNRIKQIKVIGEVNRQAQAVGDSMKGSLDSIQGMIGDIPIIGGALDSLTKGGFENMNAVLDRGVRGFTVGFERGFRNVTAAGGNFTTAFAGGMKKGFGFAIGSAKTLAASLMGPQMIIAGIVAVLALAVAGFSKLDAAAKAFREETGLTNSQMVGLDSTIKSVSMNNAALGVSMEDVSKAAAEFTKEFEGLMIPSAAVLDNVTALEKNFGVAASTQAKVNSLFQETAGLSAEAAQFQIAQVTQAANLAGVAPTRVLEDIANSAEAASNFFGGSVEELSKAAVKAAALGTSIKQASEVADNLMDFESSINAELEASAMLGQSINFNKARELAATGDIVGAQQSVLDSLESTVDLNKLNKFQLDSIAKASGMPVSELKKQLNLRKQFGKLDEAGMRAAENLLASGKDLNDISDNELAAATAQVRAQDEMKSRMDKLKAVFGGIGTTIMAALAPLGELLITPLISLGKIILPVFQLLGKVLSLAFKPVLLIFRLMNKIVQPIIDAFSGMFSELDPFFAKMDEMYTQLEEGMGPVFEMIGQVLGTIFSLIGSVIGIMVDGFMLLYDFVIAPIISVISSIGSFLGFGGGDNEEPVAMAKGGVVNSPTNAIIGEAGPEAVIPLDRMGGMGSDAVVSAIQTLGNEIKNLQIRIDMDGRAVAAGVSKVVNRDTSNKFNQPV